MKSPNAIHFENRDAWRTWLEANHDKETEIWLVYYKKHTQKPSVQYEEAVQEAICFGWIDSIVKRIDDEKYMQKYTPRKPNSIWSQLNKKRAEKMIKEGRMTDAGRAKIEEAKENGQWDKATSSKRTFAMPPDLKKALKGNQAAWDNFTSFTKSQQNMYIGWVVSAKREETRERRIREVVKRSALNQKPGMM